MYMVYLRAAAEQYNYKMYRPRSDLFGCSYNYKQYTGLFYGDERCPGVRATSSHHWFAAVVCKMEITSREYYSFCVISSMI